MLSIRTLKQLKDVLKDPSAVGPKEAYYMIRGQPNITVLVPGKYGEEFVKTYGHYHFRDQVETYEILHGQGLLLIQKRGDADEKLAEIKICEIKKGDVLEVPQSFAHTLINIGSDFLVTADDAPTNAEIEVNDYQTIKKLRGFGYYIVDDGQGGWRAVENEMYTKVPELRAESAH